MPSRVLVTGAGGLIGSAVVSTLAAAGAAVTALDRRPFEHPGAARTLVGDAGDPEAVREVLAGPAGVVDAVVHLAAVPHPSLGTPLEVFRTNVVATFTVLATAAELGVRRAVTASSINASGVPQNAHRPMPAYFPLDEDLPDDIEDAYSLSKAVDERTARMVHRRWGTDVVALRFPHVAGTGALRRVAAAARSDPGATVREGWSWLHVQDAAAAVLAALTHAPGGAHVVGLAAEETLLDVPTAEALARWAPGVPQRVAPYGRSGLVDTSRARALLGFRPTHSPPSLLDAPGARPEPIPDRSDRAAHPVVR
ncbi:nucleoside-diphosphate-sugar epimerase [Kineococcus rhizosphaerae]|uniref:Nucleoside-diphosphate-sugar epimerase n=1 Tax=Kineococcus rhizosphaerae TaxID=559628 RepID=A0A2T0R8R5_9ACTN|nr:nucleoside-diphosphate-sugar epimerase [Kineococcus rhizosphaerae]